MAELLHLAKGVAKKRGLDVFQTEHGVCSLLSFYDPVELSACQAGRLKDMGCANMPITKNQPFSEERAGKMCDDVLNNSPFKANG